MPYTPEKLAASVAAMAARYPSLKFRTEDRDGVEWAVWEGWLQPIRTPVGLDTIVQDLDDDRPVVIDRETASITHNPGCGRSHEPHPVTGQLRRPDRPFRVRIEHDGGTAHPVGYLLDPVVTAATRCHVVGANRICAYQPTSGAWCVDTHTVADFTDHVLIWLFKWNTWVETKYWLGSEAPHDRWYLFATTTPTQQCWCGSGEKYADCHRKEDSKVARAYIAKFAVMMSPLFGVGSPRP